MENGFDAAFLGQASEFAVDVSDITELQGANAIKELLDSLISMDLRFFTLTSILKPKPAP